MSAESPMKSGMTTPTSVTKARDLRQNLSLAQGPQPYDPSSAEKCLTLADKSVSVVGLIQQKNCCCDECKACGKCCLPDSDRDVILRKFNDTIVTDRLERLGTYAQDFGDTKIRKRGENSIYMRSVRVRGEYFSVAYQLVAQTYQSMEGRPRTSPNISQEPNRLLRQKSDG